MSKRRRKSSGDNKGIYAALIVLGIAASSAAFFAFNAQMEDVVIATENIVANTEIIPEMVATKKVDKSALPPNYIRAGEIQSLTGLYTNIGLTEGSIFTAGNLATKDTKKRLSFQKVKLCWQSIFHHFQKVSMLEIESTYWLECHLQKAELC